MHQSESSKEQRGLEVTPELDFQYGCCLNATLMSHKMAPRFLYNLWTPAYVIKNTYIAISLEKTKKIFHKDMFFLIFSLPMLVSCNQTTAWLIPVINIFRVPPS